MRGFQHEQAKKMLLLREAFNYLIEFRLTISN